MSSEKKRNDRSDKWQVSSEKKQVTIVLPYMCMISTELKVKLHKTFKQLLSACDLRVISKEWYPRPGSFLTHEELFQLQRQN